ncbi:MAG: hypothetical protein AAF996_01895 [Pseudomonadota bacterium]
MSRARTAKYALPLIALVTSVACASNPNTMAASAEDGTYKEAITDALTPATEEQKELANRSDPLTRASFWANEHQKDPLDLDTTIEFMNALRTIGSHDRVMEVARTAAPVHPESYEIFLEFGRSLVAQGSYTQATQALGRSADLAPPTEAAPLAALGLAFDQMGEHEKAQTAYKFALERDPNRTSTLSNYGLSLALTGQLHDAEAVLRKAVDAPGADVRVRQNLALVLGLQGRFDEMVAVDPNAPQRSIEANRRALEDMIGPNAADFSNLDGLDNVLDTLERTPAAEQVMPDLGEAVVESESMQEPLAAANVTEPALAGEGPQPSTPVLRPTLRGSQGG